MADLNEQEARILKQFLDDPNGRAALKAFFQDQVSQSEAKSQAHLRQYNMSMAQESASFANAFQSGFSLLEEFSRKQNKRFE